MARAMRSLPVPDSPSSRTVTSASRATRSMCCFSRRIAGDAPSTSGKGLSRADATERSGRTPRQRDKTLDPTETHEADEKTPSSRPIDAQRGEPERQARIEVRRVGDPLHLLDGAFDVVAPADVERGRVERAAPLRARV